MSATDYIIGGLALVVGLVVARAAADDSVSDADLEDLDSVDNVDPSGTGTDSTSAGDELQAPDGTTYDVDGGF